MLATPCQGQVVCPSLGDTAYQPPEFGKPVELAGHVYHPSDAARDPYPTVLFRHGIHQTCMPAPSGGVATTA
ncbi:hypothetical protein N8J89_14655 [Crossiella sp. CA-258035]|uniref:hypothetical protein n=1 Tax=Crossiella sp. CA-258035 TaxID=2981138 RepID=UPI0024BC0521|nr:hypothetical protein [Crossiella sp. CA-258035]WHT22255.1 hypothetical protein N8J89_14655 [Crossiella sp. CA-258035]